MYAEPSFYTTFLPDHSTTATHLHPQHLLFPWIPYWSPPHVAAWHGLASSISHKIANALLTGPFQDYGYFSSSNHREEDSLLDRSSLVDNSSTDANTISRQLHQQQQQKQQQQQQQQQQHENLQVQRLRRPLVVYLTRPSTATRYVTNEKEILSR